MLLNDCWEADKALQRETGETEAARHTESSLEQVWVLMYSEYAGRHNLVIGMGAISTTYSFNLQMTPTSSQYQSTPFQMVMPCGSGSESDN